MTYKCTECDMTFETTAELANHKQKFCDNGIYGNAYSLDTRMKELQNVNNDIDLTYQPKKAVLRKVIQPKPLYEHKQKKFKSESGDNKYK